jgi:hypothetical protein
MDSRLAPLAAILSPRGLERLVHLGFERPAAYSAGLDALHEVLDRERLPRYAEVDSLEERFGGLFKTYRHGSSWIFFGAYGMLADLGQSQDHAEAAADCKELENGADWPRVRLEGESLVAVGSDVDATYYCAPGGKILVHDWLSDIVTPAADDATVLFERVLLRLTFREYAGGGGGALTLPGQASESIAARLGLVEAPYATDSLERWWEDALGQTLLVQSKDEARLATTKPSDLVAARKK